MEMASIIDQYYDAFMIKYADTALPGHLKAMNAICSCRTPDSGELYAKLAGREACGTRSLRACGELAGRASLRDVP